MDEKEKEALAQLEKILDDFKEEFRDFLKDNKINKEIENQLREIEEKYIRKANSCVPTKLN